MPYAFPPVDAKQMTLLGYFPSGLPPFFSTSSFANHLSNPINFSRLESSLANHVSNGTTFNFPKNYKTRRSGRIVNPLGHVMMLSFIKSKKSFINKQLKKSSISLSLPIIAGQKASNAKYIGSSSIRFIEPQNKHFELYGRRIKAAISKRFLLKIDLSNFYSGIYVHSVIWSVLGKDEGKRIWRSNGPRPQDYTDANRLETVLKSIQDKETRGIPIGHDFSYLVSEMILSGIDKLIEERLKIGVSAEGFRHVDDYHIYFNSLDEAQNGLEVIRSILQEHGLHLNEEKLSLVEFPFEVEDAWIDELSELEIPSEPERYQSFLRSLIRRASKLRAEGVNDKALKYCFQIIRPYKDKKDIAKLDSLMLSNWDQYQAAVAYILKLDFRNINIVYDIIGYTKRANGQAKINDIVEVILGYALTVKEDHCYEISWICWIVREYWSDFSSAPNFNEWFIKFSKRVVILGTPVSAISVIWLDHEKNILPASSKKQLSIEMKRRLRLNGRVSRQYGKGIVSGLLGTSDWLLIYTLCQKNWLGFSSNWLSDEYQTLKDSGVEFVISPTSLSQKDQDLGISIAGVGGFSSASYI